MAMQTQTKRILRASFDVLKWYYVEKRAKIKSNEWAFLCNGHFGETYFTCGFVEAFRKAHKNDPVTIVLPNNKRFVAELFQHISRIVTFDNLPTALANPVMAMIRKPQKGRLLPGAGVADYIQLSDKMTIFNFAEIPLGLGHSAKFSKPIRPNKKSITKAKKFLLGKGLRPSKTAIIFPYPRTVSFLPTVSWDKIINRLKSIGWDVATNVIGEEKELPGTKRLNFNFSEVHAIVEAAGWVIALRSGVCDIISSARCKKTFLYIKNSNYYNCGAFKRDLNEFDMLSKIDIPGGSDIEEYVINKFIYSREVKKIFHYYTK